MKVSHSQQLLKYNDIDVYSAQTVSGDLAAASLVINVKLPKCVRC